MTPLSVRAALVLAATDAAEAATETRSVTTMRLALGVLRDAVTLTRALTDGRPARDLANLLEVADALVSRLTRHVTERDAAQRDARLEDGEG